MEPLVYLEAGSFAQAAPRTLVWVDREGREEPLGAEPHAYMTPRLSPDGTRVALHRADETLDLWAWDLARKNLTRLTDDPGGDLSPLWLDNRRLIFSASRIGVGVGGGVPNIFVQPADGTGSVTRLTDGPNPHFATSLTPDSRRVIFTETTPTQARDLRVLTLAPTPTADALVATRFEERNGTVSPDGRWLADADEPVGPAGGLRPAFSGRGREPVAGFDSRRRAAALEPERPGAVLSRGWPVDGGCGGCQRRRLARRFPDSSAWGRYFDGAGNVLRHYDVSRDGRRFLMIKDEAANAASSGQIIVVQNWFEELKCLVPVN